jgi:hypothetical protein
VTTSARFGPTATWLSMPWRLASAFVVRASVRAAGGQPRVLLFAGIVTSVAIAVAQAAEAHQWTTVAVLGALGVFPLVLPPVDAALSRAVSDRPTDSPPRLDLAMR